MGEPVRRIAGKRLRDYFQEKVAGPLGVDFFMGVPDSELSRCADLVMAPRPEDARSPVGAAEEDSTDRMEQMRYCIYNNPSLASYDFNSAEWRRAEFPSTSPQSNARSVASVFGELAAIVAGKRSGILDRSLLQRAIEIESDGEDLNVQRPTRFGLGFQLTQPVRPLGPNPRTFGHYGNGGHVGFADPDAGIGFAYHMNHHGYAWRDPRNLALVEATYVSL
ncbi:MAG: serine hydrolase domain-containing protein [Gammaproteobacteria bacterium]|nr:serine hydrolase domain-containing protein [Gammaproteobacteria bacterium]